LIITCLWRSLYFSVPGPSILQMTPTPEFVEFAHQYSIVKDLKVTILRLQVEES